MNWLKIIEGGQVLDHRKLNVYLLSFIPQSLSTDYTSEPIPGLPGSVFTSAHYGQRTIRAEFGAIGYDHLDLQLIRDEFYAMLATPKTKQLIDMRQPGKMWEAVSGEFGMEYVSPTAARFQVDFQSFSPFAKSVVRTSENEFRFDSQKLQFGQGIPTELLVYRFASRSFRVYNAGNVPVDLRNQDAVITFKGASNRLRIRNLTSGADWRYQGTTTANDTIRLERGCRALKNGQTILAQTNLEAFTLSPGWNEIRIDGSSGSIEVRFDFRFLYI